MKKSYRVILLMFLALIISKGLSAQAITSSEVDELTESTLKAFDVPGIAVAIIKDGKVVHSKRLWSPLTGIT